MWGEGWGRQVMRCGGGGIGYPVHSTSWLYQHLVNGVYGSYSISPPLFPLLPLLPPSLPNQHVPSLGELLCLLAPAGFTWTDVSDAYVEEAMARNVLWLLKKHSELDTDKPDPK